MRKTGFVALAFVAGIVCASPAARAGDCDGTSHYTYDHGECTDKTGDTFEVMEKSYDESYRLNTGMVQRSITKYGGARRRAGGVNTKDMARAVTMIVGFQAAAISPGVAALVARVRPSARAETARTAKLNLAAYNAFAPQRRFFPTLYPSAMLFATEAAYLAYNGDHFNNPNFQDVVFSALANRFAENAAAERFTNAEKQQLNDVNAIIGVELLLEHARAIKSHDSKALAVTRSQARRYMMALWHIDPAKTRIDDFVCLENAVGPCSHWKWLISGGKLGASPFDDLMRGAGATR